MMATDPQKKPESERPGAETPDPTEGGRPSAEELVPGLADAVAAEESNVLEQRLQEVEAERDELKDKLMRALAETENVRRRAERERKDAETYGGTKLARDLLSVLDNLERAMEAADDDMRRAYPGFFEGLELTHRELLNAFSKHRIEKVSPGQGERFDPNIHQAMFEVPTNDVPPGTVFQVMQPGFTIADRLLRPALVGVAKAMPTEQGPDESDADDRAGGAAGPG